MPPKSVCRRIFRPAAVKHQLRRQEEVVFPRFVRPPIFLGLWVVLALLGSVAGMAWATKVPVYVRGIALVNPLGNGGETVLIVLSAKGPSGVRRGGRVFVDVSPSRPPFRAQVAATDSSAIELETVFPAWRGSKDAELIEARWLTGEAAELPDDLEEGQVFLARVEVGETRLLAFVPVVGRWLEDDAG